MSVGVRRWVEVSRYRTTSLCYCVGWEEFCAITTMSCTYNTSLTTPKEVGAFQLGMKKEAVC